MPCRLQVSIYPLSLIATKNVGAHMLLLVLIMGDLEMVLTPHNINFLELQIGL